MTNHDFSSKVENLKDYPIDFATEAKTEFVKTHKVYDRVTTIHSKSLWDQCDLDFRIRLNDNKKLQTGKFFSFKSNQSCN